ncbi:MAG: hypothetical protein IMW89_05810 [Ktedonobacteraceae bacterium]|nr:hypothetical protein [Ktedonobacteraceae bacterium]
MKIELTGAHRRSCGGRIIKALPLLTLFVLVSLLYPTDIAAHANQRYIIAAPGDTTVNARIYLPISALKPLFQSRIDQQVPGAFSAAINAMLGQLSPENRGWASEMATTLIQPSASLTQLTVRQDGLVASLKLSLYPGDPRPINATMLVKFSVSNASTVQVSAQPLNGSPAPVNGPLTTMQIPLGQLKRIATTPSCGDSALAVNLQFPLSLNGENGNGGTVPQNVSQSYPQNSSQPRTHSLTTDQQLKAGQVARRSAPQDGISSVIEIPADALATLGSSIDTLSISKNLSARNIHIAVSGTELAVTSDILFDALKLGTATTYVQPAVANGGLVVHVQRTTLTILKILTFPYNTYNQQIEQTLNSRLNGALAGKFTATGASIGPDDHLPCAVSNSLVMTGSVRI